MFSTTTQSTTAPSTTSKTINNAEQFLLAIHNGIRNFSNYEIKNVDLSLTAMQAFSKQKLYTTIVKQAMSGNKKITKKAKDLVVKGGGILIKEMKNSLFTENKEVSAFEHKNKFLMDNRSSKPPLEQCLSGFFFGLIFDNAVLEGTNFSDLKFVNCSFRNAKMKGINFTGAEFYKIDFNGADLDNVNFTKTEMNSVSFKKTSMQCVKVTGTLSDIDFSQVNLKKSELVIKGENINFSGNLNGVKFGNPNYRHTVFKKCNFQGNLVDTDWNNIIFGGINFTNCDMSYSKINNLVFKDNPAEQIGNSEILMVNLLGAQLENIQFFKHQSDNSLVKVKEVCGRGVSVVNTKLPLDLEEQLKNSAMFPTEAALFFSSNLSEFMQEYVQEVKKLEALQQKTENSITENNKQAEEPKEIVAQAKKVLNFFNTAKSPLIRVQEKNRLTDVTVVCRL